MKKVIQLLEFEKSTLNDLVKYETADFHDIQMIEEINQAVQLLQSCVVGQGEQLVCPRCNSAVIVTDERHNVKMCGVCKHQWAD